MLRKVSLAVIASVLATSSSGPTVARSRPIGQYHEREGLCRRAPDLKPLSAETTPQDQGQTRPGKPLAGGSAKKSKSVASPSVGDFPPPAPPPVAMPSPPSPVMAPPSMPMPMPEPVAGAASEAMEDAASADGGEIVTTGARREGGDSSVRVEEAVATPPPPPPPPHMMPPHDRRRPQTGQLTAGEHDDLLNPELYARYVRTSNLGQAIPDLPVLDTRRVLTVVVTDNRGQPVPFADVRLTCADGNSLSFKAMADGSVTFFPTLDRLGKSVRLNVAGAAERKLLIDSAPGAQRISITTRAAALPTRKLDLALVVDTTGSMSDEMRYLNAELQGIVDALKRRHAGIDIRIGLVFYKDIGDDYVTRSFGFDGNVETVRQRLSVETAQGGGDYPEAMDQALNRAIQFGWRADAVKSMLLVADAPPHDDRFKPSWQAAEAARTKRIHITPVAASGVADKAEYAMRAMAALTQSRYLFLTDDSGIGNAHAAPAVDCYLVTRLDALVRRVLDSQISGRRIEPDASEVIRKVGTSDAGKCVLPSDFRDQ